MLKKSSIEYRAAHPPLIGQTIVPSFKNPPRVCLQNKYVQFQADRLRSPMFVENFLKSPSNSSYSSAASASLSGKLPGIEEELEMNESSIIQTHETMLHSPGTPGRKMKKNRFSR